MTAVGGGGLGGHLWHGVVTVSALAGMWVADTVGRRRRGHQAPRPVAADGLGRASQVLVPVVGLAFIGAACVHLVVFPTHLREAGIYGGFFGATVVAQLTFATLVMTRPSRSVLVAGLVSNVALVGLWLVTRTIGIPLGPSAGQTETVGGLDVVAVAFEVAAVAASAMLLRGRTVPRASRFREWARPVRLAVPVAASVVLVTALVGGVS